jgi:hypothetical protein
VLARQGDEAWGKHFRAADAAFRRRAREVASEQGMLTEGAANLLSDEALLRALAWYMAERAASSPDDAQSLLRLVSPCLAQARACARDAWELAQREGEKAARGADAQSEALRLLTERREGAVPTDGEAADVSQGAPPVCQDEPGDGSGEWPDGGPLEGGGE